MNMIETYTASRTDEQIARIVADLVWRTEGYLNEVARVVEGFNEKIAKGHALTSFDTDALVEAVGRQRTVHQVHAAATQELPEGKDERDRLNHLLSILQGGTFWVTKSTSYTDQWINQIDQATRSDLADRIR